MMVRSQAPLQEAPQLHPDVHLAGVKLGLAGEHQLVNASLAVALCRIWAERMGRKSEAQEFDQVSVHHAGKWRDIICF